MPAPDRTATLTQCWRPVGNPPKTRGGCRRDLAGQLEGAPVDAVEEVEEGRGKGGASVTDSTLTRARTNTAAAGQTGGRGANGDYEMRGDVRQGSGTGMAHRRGTEKQAGGGVGPSEGRSLSNRSTEIV